MRRSLPASAYPLGVIFYELLAGERPFDAQTPNGLMRQHLNMKPPPLRQRAPAAGERLARLVHDMLAKEGVKRPSMVQVQQRLLSHAQRADHGRAQRYFLLVAGVMALGFAGSWRVLRRDDRAGAPPLFRAGASVAAGPAWAVGARPGPAAHAAGSAERRAGSPLAAAAGEAAAGPAASSLPPARLVGSPAGELGQASPASAALPAAGRPVGAAGGSDPGRGAKTAARAAAAGKHHGHHETSKRDATLAPAPAGGVLKAIDFGRL